jgi:hypothetical protein
VASDGARLLLTLVVHRFSLPNAPNHTLGGLKFFRSLRGWWPVVFLGDEQSISQGFLSLFHLLLMF